jgi:hypothetical protein
MVLFDIIQIIKTEPCDGHFFIFTFLLTNKIEFKTLNAFLLACGGCKKKLWGEGLCVHLRI